MANLTHEEIKRKAIEKEKNYEIINDNYICKTCKSKILAIHVAFPIWNGPFPMSGSGQCHYEYFPYCPKCETKPEINGIPIQC